MKPHVVIPLIMKAIALLLFCTALFSCESRLSEAQQQELIARGNQISQTLSGALMGKLMAEIQANGAPAAIQYCSLQALPMTDSISKAEQAWISRISHRNRNPQNAADATELELIASYQAQLNRAESLAPQLVMREKKPVYYAPIRIASAVCLQCHGKTGSDISPDLQEELRKRYPEDKATGFAEGELRGLFKVRFE